MWANIITIFMMNLVVSLIMKHNKIVVHVIVAAFKYWFNTDKH